MRVCRKCDVVKSNASFRPGQSGGTRNTCRQCEGQLRKGRKHADPVGTARVTARAEAKKSKMRREGVQVERWIFEDAKREDRRRGYSFDLTKEWIAETISSGCHYCGETELRMTLDRIHNNVGHTRDNVVPACIRCNFLRRDMPYDAWLALSPQVRAVRDRGLFGTWTGCVRKRHDNPVVE